MSWNAGIIKKRLNPDSTILLQDQVFGKYMEEVQRVTNELHINFQDHARLFMDKKYFFSDPKHLNTAGQKEYSNYLLETLLKTKEN